MDKSNVVPIRPKKTVKGLNGKPIQLSDRALSAILKAVDNSGKPASDD
jgi:hypothetical protein